MMTAALRAIAPRRSVRSLLAGAAALVAAANSVAAQNAPTALAAAPQQPLPSAILIFDGSGSMWGEMEGLKQTKLTLAREAVKQALAKLAPQSTQLGLMSFGHRRQADCTDVQLIAPPELAGPPAFTDRIMTPLDKLNPKGKGPLTAALREAAKVLGAASGPRSIVLVHDDPDNCREDPCDALPELQAAAPGVIVHVVGLGLKPDKSSIYQCLTKPTGGKFVDAQDAAAITAGIPEVMQLAALGATEAAGSKPGKGAPATSIAAAAAPIDIVRDGPPAIRLHALLAKGRAIQAARVQWSIFTSPIRDGQSPVVVTEGTDAVSQLSPGTYLVRVVSGLMTGEANVTVAQKGQALAEVEFAAGEIRLAAPPPVDAAVIIAERSADAAAVPGKALPGRAKAGRRLGIWPQGERGLLVPPGRLVLVREQGELRADWTVDVAAGDVRDLDMAQPGGRVRLDLLPETGPPLSGRAPFANQPVVFAIEEDDPDAPQGRRELARSAMPVAEFVVAPGTYMVTARRGAFETRERIAVSAGEVVQRSLPLAASRLFLTARLPNSSAPLGPQSTDSFLVTRLDGDTAASVVVSGSDATLDVPPGRYRVEVRRNNAAILADQSVELRAGEYKAVALAYQAGELRVDAADILDAGRAVSWRVLDANGRLVDSGDENSLRTLLAAGNYTLRVDVGGKRSEQIVEVRPGEVSAVRLR